MRSLALRLAKASCFAILTMKPRRIVHNDNRIHILSPINSTFLRHEIVCKNGSLLFITSISSIAVALINVLIPKYIGKFINCLAILHLIPFKSSVILLTLGVLNGVFTTIYIQSLAVMGENVAFQIKQRIMALLLNAEISFHDMNSSAKSMQRLDADINEFKHALKQTLGQGLKSITQLIGSSISLFMISGKLACAMFITLPTVYLIGNIYGKHLQKLSKAMKMLDESNFAEANDSLTNIRTVRAYSREDKELDKFTMKAKEARFHHNQLGFHIAMLQGLTNSFINTFMVSILHAGGFMVLQNELSVGDFMAFLLASQNTQKSFNSIGSLFSQLLKLKNCSQRLCEFTDSIELFQSGSFCSEKLKGKIKFSNVGFEYANRANHKVLDNFSFEIKPGSVVALCGPSGSGKSTTIALIERFYDPSHGSIEIDDIPIEEYNSSWLRSQIGFISQEPILFNSSIKENIAFGKLDASDAEIEAAAKLANAHAFIQKFPAAYNTMVGERGTALSGGQKQRIAIARAILKDPSILILDEATSALDSSSESLVQQAIDNVMEGRTVIIIAHRLATIQKADNILVVDSGRIVESGSHDELMKKRGFYARMQGSFME